MTTDFSWFCIVSKYDHWLDYNTVCNVGLQLEVSDSNMWTCSLISISHQTSSILSSICLSLPMKGTGDNHKPLAMGTASRPRPFSTKGNYRWLEKLQGRTGKRTGWAWSILSHQNIRNSLEELTGVHKRTMIRACHLDKSRVIWEE